MALKTSGTKLVIDGLPQYVGGMNSAIAANTRLGQSINNLGKSSGRDPFAGTVAQANRAATQIEQRFSRLNQTINSGRGQQIGGAIVGGVAGFLGVQSAAALVQSAASLDELRGRVTSTNTALELLAGGSKQAADAIAAIQSVAPGTTDSLAAAEAAVSILTQKLPTAAVSMKEIAAFAATVPRISSSISDSSDALGQLTLFASSGSFARADQLGVTADEVKRRMKELAAVFPELSDAQIKAAATVQALNDRFGPLQDQLANQVTGWQKLKTAITEARIELAKGPVGAAADAAFGVVAQGVEASGRAVRADAPVGLIGTSFADIQAADAKIRADDLEASLRLLESTKQRLESERGGAGFDPEALSRVNGLIAEAQSKLIGVNVELGLATSNTNNLAGGFQSAVDAAAFLPSTVANIADPLEGFRDASAEIENLFSRINSLGDVPGVDALRNQAISLANELVITGKTTDETDAALLALNNTVNSFSAGGAIGELRNLTIAEIEARQAAQELSAAIAGISGRAVSGLSGLIGRGLINEQQANTLNNAFQPQIQAARQRFDQQGLSGAALDFAVAATERRLLAPIQQIEESDRQRLTAAKATEKAFKDAAGEAEKTADALRKALESTPGLFGLSEVTQQQLDLAKNGVPQNFADDFVRRLAAEIDPETGKITDKFDDVSVDQAREALGRIGIQAADDPRTVLAQLQEAWNNSSLFAAKENLALINKDAVEQNQRLQEQMEQGRKNIYEFFGVAIEDATEAISGGGGGGIAASVPLTDEQINEIANNINAGVVDAANASIAALFGASAEARAGGNAIPSQADFLNQLLGGTTEGRAGGEALPNVNELIGTLITGALGGTGLTGEGAPNINEQLSTILTDAGTSIQDQFVTPLSDTQEPIENFRVGLDGLTSPLTDTGTAALEFTNSIGGVTVGFTDIIDPLNKTNKQIDALGDRAEAAADKLNTIVNPDAPLPTDPATTAGVDTVGAFALGTRNYPGGVGLGGEGGPELFITPSGRAGFIGLRGAQRFSLPQGSVILDAGTTRNMVGGIPTRQIISSPSNVDNRTITTNLNLNVESLQSTGSIIRDFSLMRVLGAY